MRQKKTEHDRKLKTCYNFFYVLCTRKSRYVLSYDVEFCHKDR